jgi:hypothetical protein
MKFTKERVIIFFALATFFYFKPYFLKISSILPGDYDELFITWSITSMAKKLPSLPEKLMQANIFYPHPYSQAYSDPFIFSGLITKPLLQFFKQPAAVFNFNLILSQFLLLVFTYIFLEKLTKQKLLSILLSLVFSFSQIHLHYVPHLHTFMVFFLPLTGFFLLKLKQSRKIIFLYLASLSFILQTLNSFLPGVFIIFLSINLILAYPELKKLILKNKLHVFSNLLLSILFIGPVALIYFKVAKHFNYVRPLTEVIHFSLSPEEVVTKFFSPAAYFLILLAILNLIFKKPKKIANSKNHKKKALIFFLVSFFAFILSLGPALHWQKQTIKIPFHIPLPYLLFYFLVPGFKGFRTPSRFMVLSLFLAITASSLSLKNLFKNKKAKFLIIFLSLILLTSNLKKPNFVNIPQQKDYPPVYSWLKNQPGKTVIELPIYAWGEQKEVYRMLYSLNHEKTLINGYSGYFPENYLSLVSYLKKEFPSKQTVLYLKQLKVDYIILDKSKYTKEDINKLKKIPELKKAAEFENHIVFSF